MAFLYVKNIDIVMLGYSMTWFSHRTKNVNLCHMAILSYRVHYFCLETPVRCRRFVRQVLCVRLTCQPEVEIHQGLRCMLDHHPGQGGSHDAVTSGRRYSFSCS